jgi:hypothetical protein
LSVIKYEHEHRNRIATDVFVDADAAKRLCNKLCFVYDQNSILKGYIQEISHDPFGVLLISEIQVLFNISNKRTIIMVYIILKNYFLRF